MTNISLSLTKYLLSLNLCRVGVPASHLRDRGGAMGKEANQRAAAATLRAKNETRDY